MTYASEAGKFSIALGGDFMLTRPITMHEEPAFLAVVDAFRDCDAGFVNLETVVRRLDEGTPGITRGTYMTTAPELLDDLRWFGINMVGCANNHAFDYGEGGLTATLDHLDAAGIVRAGAGRNLAEARMPGYLDTPAGRVALLATTATYRPWNRASAQRPDIRGRPGINPFPFANTYTVDGATFDALKRMSRELGFDLTRARNRAHFYSEIRGAGRARGRAGAVRRAHRARRQVPRQRRRQQAGHRGQSALDQGGAPPGRLGGGELPQPRIRADERAHRQIARRTARARRFRAAPSRAPRSTPAPTCSSATARTRRSASSSTRASRSSIRSAR